MVGVDLKYSLSTHEIHMGRIPKSLGLHYPAHAQRTQV